MIKNLKQTTLAFSLLMGLATGANAQVIWGAGSGNSSNEDIGEFTSTNGTLAGAGWTNLAAHPWTYTTNGQSAGAASISQVNAGTGAWLNSPTLATGAAMFDSDSLDIAGIARQSGVIESPSIDLSAQALAGTPLNIRFYTSYLDFTSDSMHVEFSSTGGATWNAIDIRPLGNGGGVRANYRGWINVNITPFLVGASTDCRIRFRFLDNAYFWAIDDVSIQVADPFDIAIATPGAGNTLGDAFTTAQISNYYYQPLSQVSAREYYYAARVTNRGVQDIINAGARLHIKIDMDNAGTWTNMYMDSIGIDTVPAGANVDVSDSIAWLPTMPGAYRATYYVRHNGSDASTSNDTIVRRFNISNNDYFSKVPRSATDGFPSAIGASFPGTAAGNKISEFEYGSMFFFPMGMNYRLDSVTFRAYIQSVAPGFTGGEVSVRVSEFNESGNDGVLDDTAVPNNPELSIVGIGSDTLGIPAPPATSAFLRGSAVVLDGNTLAPFMFQNNKVYLVSLAQSNTDDGLNNGSGQFTGYWYGSFDINYALNAGTDPLIAPSPVRVAEVTGAGAPVSHDWNWIGFGADQVPSIALNMTLVNTVQETVSSGVAMNVFPNPTNGLLNVQVDTKTATDIQYIMTDASGRIVRMQTNKNVVSEIATFDVQNLPAGVYFMSIKTNSGVSTQRFVKQ